MAIGREVSRVFVFFTCIASIVLFGFYKQRRILSGLPGPENRHVIYSTTQPIFLQLGYGDTPRKLGSHEGSSLIGLNKTFRKPLLSPSSSLALPDPVNETSARPRWILLSDVWGGGETPNFWPSQVASYKCHRPNEVEVCVQSRKRIIILLYDNIPFGNVRFLINQPKDSLSHFVCCDGIDVVYTTNRVLFAQADIVEFMAHKFPSPMPKRAHDRQAFMAYTLEAPYTLRQFAPYSEINLLHTFSTDADVRHSYVPPGGICVCEKLTQPVRVQFKSRQATPIAALVSNCNSYGHREKVLGYLMEKIPVHSMGSCFHNTNAPEGDVRPTLKQYPFYFALENAICLDYVTEKFFRSFETGSVPIVLSLAGWPRYERVAPSEDAYVDLSKFPSFGNAIEFLKNVSKSEELYMRHHAFRSQPFNQTKVSQQFLENVCFEQRGKGTWCHVAQAMSSKEGRKRILERRLGTYSNTASQNCLPEGTMETVLPT